MAGTEPAVFMLKPLRKEVVKPTLTTIVIETKVSGLPDCYIYLSIIF